jgi:hypothetical protein
MASPFQQQVRQRKILYIVLILVLFTGSWVWRTNVVRAQAEELAIREVDRGEVELTGAVVRLGLTGSRGLAICILWNSAIDKQKKNQWNELEVLVRSVTKLQPHFITPWLFQSWNLSYNVSVECDRIRDKYFYITRGVELLAEGERQNRNNPDLRWNVGFYMQHKICVSDETNYHRSLFQLSMIPPNERDPARFWRQTESGPVFNWAEFHKFVEKHPQLVRRLREGMHQDNVREKKRLFSCETPEAVVQFLEDNFNLPSQYRFTPPTGNLPGSLRVWEANKKDELLPPMERFPVLPLPPSERYRGMAEPRPVPFDADALTSDSTLGDDVDAYTASHAWYCYAMEPLPLPGELPGNSEPIKDRSRQRMNRYMTTLIFRSYPAQARRFMAERLQQEGWFDEEPWDVSDWFERAQDREFTGREVKVGGGTKWSESAWRRAALAWKKHGEDNHLIFPSPAAEENSRKAALRFYQRRGLGEYDRPPFLLEDGMSAEEREEYRAARWMFEYRFYRQVSNFPHHLIRTTVDANPETVACRKLFYQADKLNLDGFPERALELYRTPLKLPVWQNVTVPVRYGEIDPAVVLAGSCLPPQHPLAPGFQVLNVVFLLQERDFLAPPVQFFRRPPNPLEAWREVVLLKNKDYRRDRFMQEQTAEIQVRYLILFNRFEGKKLKEDIGRAATLLPLVPKLTHDTFRAPIFDGPFDVTDSEGVLLVDDSSTDTILDRMRLPSRRRIRQPQQTPPQAVRPGSATPTPTPVR